MKHALTFALLILVFTNCKKETVAGAQPLDPTKQYTIKYDLTDQVVQTRLGHDTIYMDFNQKINFLTDPNEYGHSWSLHLKQDFAKSYLNGLHFTCLANTGIYATDWVPQNLNDVHSSQMSTSETTVNGVKYTKVSLNRVFKFWNSMGTPQAAIDKQNALVQTKTDSVTYQSFYYFSDVFSLPNVKTTALVYTK